MKPRLTPVDWIAAWVMAVLGPPLSGTSLVRRATRAAPASDEHEEAPPAVVALATNLADRTEQHVRTMARWARAPRRLGLPIVPGWRDTCLSRAYSSTLALRARGFPAILAIGVRGERNADGLVTAHAWVTLAGRPLLDPTAGDFTPLSGAVPSSGELFRP